MIRIYNVKIPITGGEKGLLDAVIELLGVEPSHVEALKIVKRSLDARRERPPEYN